MFLALKFWETIEVVEISENKYFTYSLDSESSYNEELLNSLLTAATAELKNDASL